MAPMNIKDVLTAFSPDGKFLALTSGDGRVKTWDVGSGHMRGEFVDIASSSNSVGTATGLANGHLAVEYTSLAWGNSVSSAQKKAKKRGGTSLLLALGTGSGDVLAWDAALGELKWRKNDVNPGGVKAIVFSRSGQSLYAVGADGMVCELDSGDGRLMQKFKGSKAPLSSVAVSPDGDKLLAASAEIKIIDLSSKKRIRKFTGHPALVRAMVFAEDGQHIISAAPGDRHVAVWLCNQEKSGSGAAFTLPMEQPAVALDCSGFGTDGENVRVLALSETGIAYVWIAANVEGLAKAKPVKISVARENSGTGSPEKVRRSTRSCILAARLLSRRDGSGSVLLARGTSARPQFERVPVDGQNTHIVLHAPETGDLLSGGQKKTDLGRAAESRDVAVVGPDSAVDAVFTRAHIESDGEVLKTPRKEKKRKASMALDAEQPTGKHSKSADVLADGVSGMEVDGEQEPTMEDRLIALGLVESEERKLVEQSKALDPLVVPKADSLQVLLTQAIHADDNALLERCVAVTDPKVISNTVSRLRTHDVAKFLGLMVFKMETRPRRGLNLVPWIRAALTQHAASLMSAPSMQPVLASLYRIIDARVSVFKPLLSLSGRLDLILAQTPKENQEEARAEGPAVVYEDESSEPESEDVMDEQVHDGVAKDSSDDEQEALSALPNGHSSLQDDESSDGDDAP